MTIKAILLFGHRKRSGKDVVCDILDEYYGARGFKTRFAKLLKMQVAERYNLDYNKMEDGEYKSSIPMHLSPFPIWKKFLGIPYYKTYKKLSVREVLILEATTWARSLWNECWSHFTYLEIFKSGKEIGYVADHRFPGEYDSFSGFINMHKISTTPKLLRILVHRPNGVVENDGADDQLPDDTGVYWDYVIHNDVVGGDWHGHLKKQLFTILEKEDLL